ncbi:MAG: 50S ribosomal protein L17 [Spirochaetes bacterium]|nr:50S ribosomal protein L17 [Spirochaetota bacterium]
MRHLKKGKRLGRDKEHREAMFANLIVSLFQNERIKTTVVKAKELRRRSERLITRAKEPSLHNKRIILSRIKDRDAVAKLFDDIAPRYKNVPGGYTRIIRLGRRQGDGAELSYVELVETESSAKKKSKATAKPAAKPAAKPSAKTTVEKKTKRKSPKDSASDSK